MTTMAALLKQMRARNPKARSDALAGLLRALREERLAPAREALRDIGDALQSSELPRGLVAQVIVRLPSAELKDEYLAIVRSNDELPWATSVLRAWLPLLDADETDEVLGRVRDSMVGGDDPAAAFAALREAAVANSDDLDVLARRTCEYLDAAELGRRGTLMSELDEHLTPDEFTELRTRVQNRCGKTLPIPNSGPPPGFPRA